MTQKNIKGWTIPTIILCFLLIILCFARQFVHMKHHHDNDVKKLTSPKSTKSHGIHIVHHAIQFYQQHKSTIFLFLSLLCTSAVTGILIGYLKEYNKGLYTLDMKKYKKMKNLRISFKVLSCFNLIFIGSFILTTTCGIVKTKNFFVKHLGAVLCTVAVVMCILCFIIPLPSSTAVTAPSPSIVLPISAPSPSPQQPLSMNIIGQPTQPLFFLPPSISPIPISLPTISPSPYQPILTASPSYF